MGESSHEEALAFARRIALGRLATRAHSVEEMRVALARKKTPPAVIDELVARFTDVGLLDDRAFAEEWVRSRHEYRNASKLNLRRELRNKGVADDVIDEALAQLDDDSDRVAALAIARKRLRSLRGLDQLVVRRRLAGALARRGFNSGVISSVLSEVLSAEDDSGWFEH